MSGPIETAPRAPHDLGGVPRFMCERIDTEPHTLSEFDRTVDAIRQILGAVEVRDLLIEDESIEEVVKRIYAGQANLEVPA